jgi:5-deoxy-glucuronate isomerase
MSLLVKAQREGQRIVQVTPASAGWRHVGFAAHRLAPGAAIAASAADTAGRETCIVVLSGRVDITAGDHAWTDIGGRASVFEDQAPTAVYVPGATAYRVVARGPAEIALATAPFPATGTGGPDPTALPPRLISPEQMPRSARGKGSNQRFVCDILPHTAPAASLLVVEVRTPSAHSSSYPPHKHDRDDAPNETQLEETYYHRVDPPQGFVFQRVYTDDRSIDESHAAEDHDVVMVPRGYHPVVVPHGYASYYLNVMAGPRRLWQFKNDPAHEWMLRAGA